MNETRRNLKKATSSVLSVILINLCWQAYNPGTEEYVVKVRRIGLKLQDHWLMPIEGKVRSKLGG